MLTKVTSRLTSGHYIHKKEHCLFESLHVCVSIVEEQPLPSHHEVGEEPNRETGRSFSTLNTLGTHSHVRIPGSLKLPIST